MTEKQFMHEVAEQLGNERQAEGFNIQCRVFTKNNNTKRYGLVLQQDREKVTPTIFLQPFYENYVRDKTSIEDVAHHIAGILEQVTGQARQYQALSFQFTDCRDRIVYRLISKTMNEDLCEQIPYIPFLDLMISFCIVIGYSESGVETMRITNDQMQQWNVSTAELYRLAEKNTPRIFPARVEPLYDVLQKYLDIPDGQEPDDELILPMILIGNEAGVYGASVLLYPGLVEELAEEQGSDLFILPSSVHEFIVIPGADKNSLGELSAIVQDINAKYVCREEILSDRAYLYKRDEKKFLL